MFIKILVCGVVCFVFSYTLLALPQTQQRAIVLKRVIEKNHYSPRATDDSLSAEIFTKFLKTLDPHQYIFTAQDYAALLPYRYKLDDELNGNGWNFFDLVSKFYLTGLKRADSVINAVLQKPLDFTVDEKVTFSGEGGFTFPNNIKELNTRWTKWFKILMLSSLYDVASADSTHPSIKSLLPKYEATIRQKIKKLESGDMQAIINPAKYENYLKSVYFNAIASAFDPHTVYFSPEEKADFQSMLSSDEYSFGFYIDETNEGKIIIDDLIPGGPAWKSGEINKNDELLQLQWDNKQPVDISILTADEVDKILEEPNTGNITIKVRKTNGVTRTVVLHKEKIEKEEDIVRGYILKGEKKIGYISLPDFYTNWEDEDANNGCANDVAKEIVKLKKENIDGLILDVRYNGGGSLGEALQLIGIFIDEGPLSGKKDKTGKLVFLRDPNRGTIYDGPMVLMVNGQSASASEMLAAALQDYNRAVIVGSPSYGKATMQQIFPMDTITNNSNPSMSSDFVKITTGKLYRVTGQTAQMNGVVPDISLPDAYDGLEYQEKYSENALPSDTVKRNTYYKPLLPLPVTELTKLSTQRTSANKDIAEIKAAISKQTEMMKSKKKTVSLMPDAFQKFMEDSEALDKTMDEEEQQDSKLFKAENHQQDKQRLEANGYAKEINKIVLKNLQQDIYIEEAFNVISDLIRLLKK